MIPTLTPVLFACYALAVWPVMLFPNTVVVNEAAALKRVFLADFAESFALTFECHVEVAPSL